MKMFRSKPSIWSAGLALCCLFQLTASLVFSQQPPAGEEVFFQNKYSKGVMDVRGGSPEPSTQIWQFKLNYTIAQKFFLSRDADGTYSIISRVPGGSHLKLSLKYSPPTKTIEAPTSTSGTYSQYLFVQEEPYPPSTSPVAGTPLPVHQKWKIVPVPNEANTFRIQSAAFTGSEVVLEASSQESGTPLRLSVYSGKTSQKWVILPTAVHGQASNVQVSDLTWIPMWGCDRVQGRLTWTDEASNNTGFEIEAGGPGWAQKFTTGATSQSFSIDIAVSEEAEPGDTYCFRVLPFNPWGYGYSDSDCATADIKPTTPPPPPGVGAIRVFNCHNGQLAVRIWTYDLTVDNGQWQDRGAIPSQWSGSSCPGNATPLTFSLADGHNYVLKAIDCGNGTPPQTQGSCHRLTTTNALPGKTGGATLTFTVN